MLKKLKFAIIIIIVFGASELLFRINSNKVNILSAYYISQAQRSIDKNEFQDSLNYLSRAAKYNIKNISKNYAGLIPADYNPTLSLSNNKDLEKPFSDYISKINPWKILISKKNNLSKVFYDLGVVSYQDGMNSDKIIIELLQTSIFLNPELSYPHLELANYYLIQKDKENAQKGLDYCLKFIYAKKHCAEYFSNNFPDNPPFKFGFLEEESTKYYSSK